MECNKDEAVRAKEIAERKFMEGDYVRAKKFALKAHNLYPELDGLAQLLSVFDVYISAEGKVDGGEVDWYGVLGVSPWADDETIKKNYRNLACTLHPDKNKSVGADGAFKLVSEAWSLLSDKARRLAYNKTNLMGMQPRISPQIEVLSTTPNAHGFHNCSSAVTSDARTHSKVNRMRPTSVSSPSCQRPDTFWTACNRCKMQYEYQRIYLNHNLLCPNCKEAFFAIEKPPPPDVMKSSNHFFHRKNQNSRQHSDFCWNHFARMPNAGGMVTSPSAAEAASVVHEAQKQLKREHEERATAEKERNHISNRMCTAVKVDELFKKRRPNATCINSYGAGMLNQMAMQNGGVSVGSVSEPRWGHYRKESCSFSDISNKPKALKDLSPIEVKNMLVEKARLDIRKNLEVWSLKQVNMTKNKKQKTVLTNESNDHKMYDDSAIMDKGVRNEKTLPSFSLDDSNKEAPTPLSINVPDPDFYNFDSDRSESSFGDDQVWAAYDEADGMPRYYARIHKVISLKPFKMRISWLNSRSSTEFGPLDWVGSGFLKTCGDFRLGKHETSETLNSFSHIVRWTKGPRGIVRILPRKGDIWALYRNWSPDWNQHTPGEVVHKYDMVEVLDDYNEEQGILVIPLSKVAGFKTVFQNQMDPSAVRKIPKEEMFRFSHQVPKHLLTGEEAHNAPKGCWELDPAAIPLELLQIITECNEVEMVASGREAEDKNDAELPKSQGRLDLEDISNC